MSESLDAEIRSAAAALASAGIESALVDAVALAAHALGTDEAEVRRRMLMRESADDAFLDRYSGLVAERAKRIPLQHLTGRAHFRRLTLSVGPGVFVPRPETEVVVDLALAAVDAAGPRPVVVDLCTGSGAIAFAIKDERPTADVHAVELSADAFAWAEQNRIRLGLDLDLRQGDATTAFADLEGQVDVVVANPPYIPVGMVPIDPEVRDHDPEVALYGGSEDGLRIPLGVAARAAQLLRPGGVLVMEHADTQGATLPAALRATGVWTGVVDHPDLTGKARATVAERAATTP